eukprot:scaffold226470_cov33-Prasinocladus_malaysianus.AAC.1
MASAQACEQIESGKLVKLLLEPSEIPQAALTLLAQALPRQTGLSGPNTAVDMFISAILTALAWQLSLARAAPHSWLQGASLHTLNA